MVLAIDHVIITAPKLDLAAEALRAATGLASVVGGEHEGHGTANRIAPVGNAYLEIMGITDDAAAAHSPLAEWVRGRPAGRPAALCLRADDLEAAAERLGTHVLPMSRRRPDGVVLSWRLVGLDQAIERGTPFFIDWDIDPDDHPSATPVEHDIVPLGIAWVELGGDAEEMARALGPHDLDLRFVGGPPGVRHIGITTTAGELVV